MNTDTDRVDTQCATAEPTQLQDGDTLYESCVAGSWDRARISLHPGKRDYRAESPNTAHAVCPPEDTLCVVHKDDHHPVDEPLAHLRGDVFPALSRRFGSLRDRFPYPFR